MMKPRKKRGVSIVDALLALVVTALIGGSILSFTQMGDLMWSTTTATQNSKDTLYFAINKMAPIIRNGLRVDPSSTATEAVIVAPKVDAINGGYVTPLTDGDVYRFYLSDLTGAVGAKGTILWMSKNGAPDKAWSLRTGSSGSIGTADLGSQSLSFSYSPATNPNSVKITVTTSKSAGYIKPIQTTSSATIILRNFEAANQ